MNDKENTTSQATKTASSKYKLSVQLKKTHEVETNPST